MTLQEVYALACTFQTVEMLVPFWRNSGSIPEYTERQRERLSRQAPDADGTMRPIEAFLPQSVVAGFARFQQEVAEYETVLLAEYEKAQQAFDRAVRDYLETTYGVDLTRPIRVGADRAGKYVRTKSMRHIQGQQGGWYRFELQLGRTTVYFEVGISSLTQA